MSSFLDSIKGFFSGLFGGEKKSTPAPSTTPSTPAKPAAKSTPKCPAIKLQSLKILNNRNNPGELKPIKPDEDVPPKKEAKITLQPLKILNNRKAEVIDDKKEIKKTETVKIHDDKEDPKPPAAQAKAKKPAPKKKK